MNSEINIHELRNKYQMSRKEFAEYFEIPYRTVQDWELGNRAIQPYLYRLMVYKLATDKLATDKLATDQLDKNNQL